MILMITLSLLVIHKSVTYGEEQYHTNKEQASILGHGVRNMQGSDAFKPAINKEIEKSWRIKRDPFGINARGFHVDVFSRDFGNFKPYKRNEGNLYTSASREKRSAMSDVNIPKLQVEMVTKRKGVKASTHEPEQDTMDKETRLVKPYGKRYYSTYRLRNGGGFPKRRPTNDFYGDAFTHGFGDFTTMKKRRPSSDFHGDAFTEGFGDFETMKKRRLAEISGLTRGSLEYAPINKRRPGADFHDNIFTQGFGDFDVMRKRRPGGDSGFHDNIFTQGFGDFDTMKKRRPSSDFHGDAFTEGFGDFSTMKKRRPSDDFHGNAFTEGFGDFSTMKKRRPNDDFHGDAFTEGFGDFSTMKKRRPSDDFHGDAFTEGFGDFSTMRKRDVEATKAERNNETHEPSIENQKQQLQAAR